MQAADRALLHPIVYVLCSFISRHQAHTIDDRSWNKGVAVQSPATQRKGPRSSERGGAVGLKFQMKK